MHGIAVANHIRLIGFVGFFILLLQVNNIALFKGVIAVKVIELWQLFPANTKLAAGINVNFFPGIGPQIENAIQTEKAIAELKDPNLEKELFYTKEAIEKTQNLLKGKTPLLGRSGA